MALAAALYLYRPPRVGEIFCSCFFCVTQYSVPHGFSLSMMSLLMVFYLGAWGCSRDASRVASHQCYILFFFSIAAAWYSAGFSLSSMMRVYFLSSADVV